MKVSDQTESPELCKHDWVGDDFCAYCALEDAEEALAELRARTVCSYCREIVNEDHHDCGGHNTPAPNPDPLEVANYVHHLSGCSTPDGCTCGLEDVLRTLSAPVPEDVEALVEGLRAISLDMGAIGIDPRADFLDDVADRIEADGRENAEYKALKTAMKGGKTMAGLVAENAAKDERIAELERWFHGYRTPEGSMAALLARAERAEGALRGIQNTTTEWQVRDLCDTALN